jgi:hypothetical protein
MTKEIEVLDRLPGCGKTTAIFKYIADNKSNPWLYLSPMKDEIRNRVPDEADKVGLKFFIATEKSSGNDYKTMGLQVLEALRNGESVACTHTLMLKFTDEHIKLIKEHKYNIVCDEELDLIKGYNSLKKGDISFLLENKHIKIDKEDGKVSFLSEMSTDSRYGDVKLYSDMECLYSAKSRNEFLVIQISPRIVEAANRFILLTYNYSGSVMDTFMKMHGFTSSELMGITTYKSNSEIINKVSELVTLIETPSIKKWQKRKGCLSATWWRSVSKEDIESIRKAVKSIMTQRKVNSTDLMVTFPMGNLTGRSSDDDKVSKLLNLPKVDTEQAYVTYNARATNKFAHKTLAIHLTNLYPMQPVMVYMQDMGFTCDSDAYALNTLIQWVFRGCIRDGNPMQVALFSDRMSNLFKKWLASSK